MNNRPCKRSCRPPDRSVLREPVMRVWPHTVQGCAPEPDRSFLRASLSYQNQTLSEIKALLEQLTLESSSGCHSGK